MASDIKKVIARNTGLNRLRVTKKSRKAAWNAARTAFKGRR